MIKSAHWDHPQENVSERPTKAASRRADKQCRLASMFDQHYDLVWRSLRRFGVTPDEVDDAAQEVFIVASRRLQDIQIGKERSFLFGTAVRIASDSRRARVRRRIDSDDADALDRLRDPSPSPDELSDQHRARELLDEVLEGMSEEQRVVFVLFELEGLTMVDIAEHLALPSGTVASRLRRAREHYQKQVERFRAARERMEAR